MPQGNSFSTNQKHHQDLGSARHQYGISTFVSQTSFGNGSSTGDLAKHRLFSQATYIVHKISEQQLRIGDFLNLDRSTYQHNYHIFLLLFLKFPWHDVTKTFPLSHRSVHGSLTPSYFLVLSGQQSCFLLCTIHLILHPRDSYGLLPLIHCPHAHTQCSLPSL